MSVMVVELYEALKEAGASEEKAQAAAKAMVGFDHRFDQLDKRIDGLEGQIRELRSDLEGQIRELRSDLEGQIRELKVEMNARFGNVDAQFKSVDAQFKSVDGQFKSLDVRFQSIDDRFKSVDAQFSMLKWMNGIVIAGVTALIIRAFFTG